jgi:hypothetical protein
MQWIAPSEKDVATDTLEKDYGLPPINSELKLIKAHAVVGSSEILPDSIVGLLRL